jgi:hypothetical protein
MSVASISATPPPVAVELTFTIFLSASAARNLAAVSRSAADRSVPISGSRRRRSMGRTGIEAAAIRRRIRTRVAPPARPEPGGVDVFASKSRNAMAWLQRVLRSKERGGWRERARVPTLRLVLCDLVLGGATMVAGLLVGLAVGI